MAIIVNLDEYLTIDSKNVHMLASFSNYRELAPNSTLEEYWDFIADHSDLYLEAVNRVLDISLDDEQLKIGNEKLEEIIRDLRYVYTTDVVHRITDNFKLINGKIQFVENEHYGLISTWDYSEQSLKVDAYAIMNFGDTKEFVIEYMYEFEGQCIPIEDLYTFLNNHTEIKYIWIEEIRLRNHDTQDVIQNNIAMLKDRPITFLNIIYWNLSSLLPGG